MREHYGFAYVDADVTSRTPQDQIDAAVEKVWEEFWRPIFERECGSSAYMGDAAFMRQLKIELFDYHQMMSNTSTVFCEVTGSRISKPHTMAHHVIEAAQENYRRDAIRDIIEDLESISEQGYEQDAPESAEKFGEVAEYLKKMYAGELKR